MTHQTTKWVTPPGGAIVNLSPPRPRHEDDRLARSLENLHDLDDDTVAVAAGLGFIGQLAELLIQAGANEGP